MLGILATAAQAALRHFDGTVLSKNAAAKTFQIKTQGGSRVTVKVGGALVAKKVEPQGGRQRQRR